MEELHSQKNVCCCAGKCYSQTKRHGPVSRSIPEAYGLIGLFNPNTSGLDGLGTPADPSKRFFDFSYNDFTGNLPMFLKGDSVPSKVQENVRLGVSIFTLCDI